MFNKVIRGVRVACASAMLIDWLSDSLKSWMTDRVYQNMLSFFAIAAALAGAVRVKAQNFKRPNAVYACGSCDYRSTHKGKTNLSHSLA